MTRLRIELVMTPAVACHQVTLEWAKHVMGFDFDTIIPSHTAAPVPHGREAFAACFPSLQEEAEPAESAKVPASS